MPRDPQRPFVLPDSATEILLVRHGSAHRGGRGAGFDEMIGGHADPDLTPLGRRQAQALAERLEGSALRGLFVTPLRRTGQTVEPLAAALGVTPEVVDDLREVHLGEWEGRWHEAGAEQLPLLRRLFEVGRWDVIPGAEPMEELTERVRAGLERVADGGGPGSTVLAVAHAGVIAEACRQVTGSRPFAFLTAENASITRLLRTDSGRWELHGFNDVSHLAGIAVD